jgi:hypothetical protein
MKIKSKPKYPKFDTYKFRLDVYIGTNCTLSELMDQCREYFSKHRNKEYRLYNYTYPEPEDIHFEDILIIQDEYDNETIFYLPLELNDEFKSRVIEEYESELKAWQEWYDENKDDIIKQENSILKAAEKTKLNSKLRKIKELKNQQLKIQSKLKELEDDTR